MYDDSFSGLATNMLNVRNNTILPKYYLALSLLYSIVVFDVEHEEYLEAVDPTSYVGTIPTWLASDILT